MSDPVGYDGECPYLKDADNWCNTLVNEVAYARTWSDTKDAIEAIRRVRTKAKSMAAEWDHLNNPSPGDKESSQSQPLATDITKLRGDGNSHGLEHD